MFKRLRNRFLLLEALALLFFIAALTGFLAVVTYIDFGNRTNEQLTAITNATLLPEGNRLPGLSKPDKPENFLFPDKNGKPERHERPEKSPMPYFMVWLDNEKKIVRIEGRPSSDFALFQAVATQAIAENEPHGMLTYEESVYKYKTIGNRMAFADVTIQVITYTRMLKTLLWFSLPVLIIIFLLSLYFANRAIRPIEEAFTKQKEFIADASHELKTPLTTINSTVDVLMDSTSEEQKRWLGYIKTEAGRMSTLITSMLDLAEIEEKSTIQLTKADFSQVIEGTLLPLEAVFYEKNISIETHIPEKVMVYGDETQLQRLVGILLDNAVKYSTGKVMIALVKSHNRAELVVANSSNYLPQAELDRIWDRFYRGDTSREYTGGFGLGLAIAKSIVDHHKGEITCSCGQDSIIRFTVKLPLA